MMTANEIGISLTFFSRYEPGLDLDTHLPMLAKHGLSAQEPPMTRVRIDPGICGFACEVEAACDDGQHVRLHIHSECPHATKLAQELDGQAIDVFEAFASGQMAGICAALPHASCPVPAGICKAIEVAAGLALPRDARITFLNPPSEANDDG